MRAVLIYAPGNDEENFSSILIVDDVFSRGRTATALVRKLREAGLPISSPITVACPLWMARK
jgi:predicted amidophosphoribosyltransferase